MFSSQSAMVLHLEGNFCDLCRLDEQAVTSIALECYAAKKYRSGFAMFPFQCPSCPTQFRVVSALMQHAESAACAEDLRGGSPLDRFLRFLDKNIHRRI